MPEFKPITPAWQEWLHNLAAEMEKHNRPRVAPDPTIAIGPDQIEFCRWCCQQIAEIVRDGRELRLDLIETDDGQMRADPGHRHACYGVKLYESYRRAPVDASSEVSE
jgi:hypothetical protein